MRIIVYILLYSLSFSVFSSPVSKQITALNTQKLNSEKAVLKSQFEHARSVKKELGLQLSIKKITIALAEVKNASDNLRQSVKEVQSLEMDSPYEYSSAQALQEYRASVLKFSRLQEKLDTLKDQLIDQEKHTKKIRLQQEKNIGINEALKLEMIMLKAEQLSNIITQERKIKASSIMPCVDKVEECERDSIKKALNQAIESGSHIMVSSSTESHILDRDGEVSGQKKSYDFTSQFKSIVTKYNIEESLCTDKQCTGYSVTLTAWVKGEASIQALCKFISSGEFCSASKNNDYTNNSHKNAENDDDVELTIKTIPISVPRMIVVDHEKILSEKNVIRVNKGKALIEVYGDNAYGVKNMVVKNNQTVVVELGPPGPYLERNDLQWSACPLGTKPESQYCEGKLKRLSWIESKNSVAESNWHNRWKLPSKTELSELINNNESEEYLERIKILGEKNVIWTDTKYGYKSGRIWVFDILKRSFIPYEKDKLAISVYVK